MLGRVLLEQEHQELLAILVEAVRNVPRDKRQKFLVTYFESRGTGKAEVVHPGLTNRTLEWYLGDLEMLTRAGLLAMTPLRGFGWELDVTPEGFAYYRMMKQQMGEPTQRLETTMNQYLTSAHFQERYPQAYQKWAAAESLLWGSDSREQLTMIGHLCREAIQEFATVLVDQFQPSHVKQDKASTVARIRTVLDLQDHMLGNTVKPFLDALLVYWGTVSDLIQRQEHGAQREGVALVWEDGRRVVFQTAILMFEFDRSLTRSG